MRLFISLNLDLKTREEISKIVNSLKTKFSNIRFIPPQNWHFTILFIGEQDKKNLPLINKSIEEAVFSFKSPKIVFDKIDYMPKNNPRMIWLTTDEKTSKNLGEIKNFLEKKLSKLNFKTSKKKYFGHLTLARAKQPFNSLEKEFFLAKSFNFIFYPKKMFLMQSFLKREGSVYKPVVEFDFKIK